MRRFSKTKAVMGAALLAGAFLICGDGTAADVIKPGDKVKIDFTCRLSSGEIAATTDKMITADPNIKKSAVFVSRKSDEPLAITAGRDEMTYGKRGQRGFEGEILADISEAIVGMKPGETRSLEVKRERIQSQGNEPMSLEMARVRMRPKEVRMTLDEYRNRTTKEPEVNQDYTIDPSFPGKVVDVSGGQVVIRFRAEPGKKIKTPLGEGEIRETDKNFEIVIDAKRGDLVRSGGMVGRIMDVDERMITIDYSHPFGYEELKCEVKVEDVSRP